MASSATWDANAGAVVLSFDIPAGKTAYSIIRTNPDGTSAAVRTEAGLLPFNGPATLVVRDFEATGGFTRYTVPGVAGTPVSLTFSIDRPLITSVLRPDRRNAPDVVSSYSARNAAMTTIHDIIGRPTPIVIMQPVKSRRGSLTFICSDGTEAAALRALYSQPEVMLLRTPEQGVAMFHVSTGEIATDAVIVQGIPTAWQVSVEYAEVAYPSGDLLSSFGWTYDKLSTVARSYAELEAMFATYDQLAVGV